ncbi:MAG: rhomboid family intramembrane serine protease [Nanoarchaeota archaeon]|nr:rhomboid family intramembrane serine protease [Nanoarchaeota archaeon]
MKFRFTALKLSAIIILVFLIQIVFPNFTELFILNSSSWLQPWRFITSIFLHGGLGHLALNLFALALFGSILEKFIGSRNLLITFFTSGILANLISVNFYNSSLGASGAIFGIIGALILIRPLMTVWAFHLPMPMFLAGIIWAIADILGTYGFLVGNPIDNTGNIAHLSGMVFGVLLGIYFRRKIKKPKINSNKITLDENTMQLWENIYLK